jgi:hypothetical protein
MSGGQITVAIAILSALAAVGGLIWRAGTMVTRTQDAINEIRKALEQLVRIDLDHEDRLRELERSAWGPAARERRERRHGGGG